MEFVVDTNVLITSFWKKSVFNRLLLIKDLSLFSPQFALEEINKYSPLIIKKTSLSKDEFEKSRFNLALKVEFIPLGEYKSKLKEALSLIKDINKEEYLELCEDIDFIALSLSLNCPLWSNDKLLKRVPGIRVLSTAEVISLLDR